MSREYADRQRRRARLQRESMELAESHFGNTPPVDYCESRDLTGVPSNHGRTYKVAESSWIMHHEIRPDGTLRAVGKVRAVGTDVRVTRPDGTTEIRPVSSFRNARNYSKRGPESDAEQLRNEQLAQHRRVHSSAMAAHTELADGSA